MRILLALAATALIVPATLRYGPAGFLTITAGVGVGFAIGELVGWVTRRWPDYDRAGDP